MTVLLQFLTRELKTYAPYPELPKLDRTREELTDSEKALYDCWTKPEYVAQVFEYLALEEDKNTDKYRMPVVKYFKVSHLFCCYIYTQARQDFIEFEPCDLIFFPLNYEFRFELKGAR